MKFVCAVCGARFSLRTGFVEEHYFPCGLERRFNELGIVKVATKWKRPTKESLIN